MPKLLFEKLEPKPGSTPEMELELAGLILLHLEMTGGSIHRGQWVPSIVNHLKHLTGHAPLADDLKMTTGGLSIYTKCSNMLNRSTERDPQKSVLGADLIRTRMHANGMYIYAGRTVLNQPGDVWWRTRYNMGEQTDLLAFLTKRRDDIAEVVARHEEVQFATTIPHTRNQTDAAERKTDQRRRTKVTQRAHGFKTRKKA